jgi:endonuclease-3 related protein
MKNTKEILYSIYQCLYDSYGPQHWWPAEDPFEVMVGAILTQNTNWKNVEKAINNLKEAKLLDPYKIQKMKSQKLASLIRPAGYFNIKAERLKAFVQYFISHYSASVEAMKGEKTHILRKKLLNVRGIGPETADSILLYALEHPVFVIDAYTKRILSRHNILDGSHNYETYQQLFHESLPLDTELFNEYHALIVRVGKEHCRTKQVCNGCPLSIFLS